MTLESKEVFHENMGIWPQKLSEMLFLALIGQNVDFLWKLGVKPEPLRHSKGSLRKKISIQKTVDISLYIDAARSECCTQAAMDPTHDDYSPSGTYGQSSVWNIPIYFFLKHPICSNAIQK